MLTLKQAKPQERCLMHVKDSFVEFEETEIPRTYNDWCMLITTLLLSWLDDHDYTSD